MTAEEMLDLLALRLEDPDSKAFSDSSKFKALNVAQLTVVNLCENSLLTELEEIEQVTLSASGTYDLATLTTTPIRNGLYAVYNNSTSVLAYVNLIDFKDVKRLENSYLSASNSNPVGWVFKNTLYVKPASADTVDVYFLGKPTDVGIGADCLLDESLHEIIVDLAESQLWKMDGQYERATVAQTNAMNILNALNGRVVSEKPQGVGTYGRVASANPKGV